LANDRRVASPRCALCSHPRKREHFRIWAVEGPRNVCAVCDDCIQRTKDIAARARREHKHRRNPRSRRYPVEPIQVLVRERMERDSQESIARDVGHESSYVRKMAKGRFPTMNLETADRWCLGLGTHLSLVYDEDDCVG
jgi:hypothetical protein